MKIPPTFVIIICILTLIFSACTPEGEALPTLVSTLPADEAPATPSEEPTIESQPVEPATAEPAFVRPTLPPTWTPAPLPTDLPTATPIIPTITPFVPVGNVIPSSCDVFDIDFENTDVQFLVGTSPTVSWIPVEGASQYRVTIANANGLIIKDDIYLAETTYSFSEDFFVFGEFYGWTVYPINTNGVQMCNFIGSQLIPSRPLGG